MKVEFRSQQAEIVVLDAKDKRLLSLLCQDGRSPKTILAKKAGLSKDAVAYRMTQFEKQGVIQGYTTVVDIDKLGFSTYHLFLKLAEPSEESKKMLIAQLQTLRSLKVIIEFSGTYDFEIGIAARSIEELDHIVKSILAPVFITEHQILILVKTLIGRTLPSDLTKEQTRKGHVQTSYDCGAKDLELLKLLSLDARQTYAFLGPALGLTGEAIAYRLKKLMASGIIKEFRPIINLDALGYSMYTILLTFANFSDDQERKFIAMCEEIPHIIWAAKTIGTFNIILYIAVRRTEDLHKTLITLRNRFSTNLTSYEALIAYQQHAYTYFPEICQQSQNPT